MIEGRVYKIKTFDYARTDEAILADYREEMRLLDEESQDEEATD